MPGLQKLYETAGGTLIAKVDTSGLAFSDLANGETVHYIVACTDPERFGPSDEPWGLEVLEFIIGGY